MRFYFMKRREVKQKKKIKIIIIIVKSTRNEKSHDWICRISYRRNIEYSNHGRLSWTILMHLYLVGFGALCTALSLSYFMLKCSQFRIYAQDIDNIIFLWSWGCRGLKITTKQNNNKKITHDCILCSLAIFHWLNIATGDCATLSIIFLLVQFFFLLLLSLVSFCYNYDRY